MSLPVRCFTCNKVIGIYEQKFQTMLENGKDMQEILNSFGLSRYCCRRMFLGYVDIVDQLLLFPSDIVSSSGQKSKSDK